MSTEPKRARGAPFGNTNGETSGLSKLKDTMKRLGSRAIDRRTSTGKALAQWRNDLVDDLGGDDTISTQQSCLIDLAVKSKLMLDSIDAWILSRPTLVNSRKKTLLPVVIQRQTLADGLARYLGQLGLERRAKVKTLQALLDAADDPPAQPANGTGAVSQTSDAERSDAGEGLGASQSDSGLNRV
jgi:hypothetical protein